MSDDIADLDGSFRRSQASEVRLASVRLDGRISKVVVLMAKHQCIQFQAGVLGSPPVHWREMPESSLAFRRWRGYHPAAREDGPPRLLKSF